ncbi:MAG: class I SAM-dependent methyltransferase [Hyphomicrobiales bacterium]
MMRATELAHLLMRRTLKSGDWALDATVGNGHDTVLLAESVGPSGRVFGFDLQATAIAATDKRVEGHSQVTLFQAGHERLSDYLPEDSQLAGIMFNLGYLPGASQEIITSADTTIAALGLALERLKVGGLLTLVLYPGHRGGDIETTAVRAFTKNLGRQFTAAQFMRFNSERPAPELLVIERTRPIFENQP